MRDASSSAERMSRRGRVLKNIVIGHVSGNDPSLMQMSAGNRERSHTLDESLKKGSMRKGPLVLKRSEANLMP